VKLNFLGICLLAGLSAQAAWRWTDDGGRTWTATNVAEFVAPDFKGSTAEANVVEFLSDCTYASTNGISFAKPVTLRSARSENGHSCPFTLRSGRSENGHSCPFTLTAAANGDIVFAGASVVSNLTISGGAVWKTPADPFDREQTEKGFLGALLVPKDATLTFGAGATLRDRPTDGGKPGISVDGTLVMNEGASLLNLRGGYPAVQVRGGSFEMTGGTISGCYNTCCWGAQYAGAVNAWRGAFRMTGGAITGNAELFCGAVHASLSDEARITIGGTARVSGNLCASAPCDITAGQTNRVVFADGRGGDYVFEAGKFIFRRTDTPVRSAVLMNGQECPFSDSFAGNRVALREGWRFRREGGDWRPVRVPHDWGVDEPFSITNAYYDAYLLPVGRGEYRRTFTLPAAWKGKRVFFESNGAMSYPEVYVNGHDVGGWAYGYTPFRVELTPHLKDGANELAVRLWNPPDSSRWYTGGGLYRDCFLAAYDEDYVIPDSVFIRATEISKEKATVLVSYERAKSGKKETSFTVEKPRFWDVDDPHLYTYELDGRTYRYGIRTISFHADERGFQLNGRRVHLKGMCLHHDLGVLGAAYDSAAQRRRFELLKEAGVNAIRTSHNEMDPDFLDLCDELGLVVMDETFDVWSVAKHSNDYNLLFREWLERDTRAWVRQDRNHPSVIMWSLGNEITEADSSPGAYADYAKQIGAYVRAEDPSRPIMGANCSKNPGWSSYTNHVDLMGFNYFAWRGWDTYAKFHKDNPTMPLLSSESICADSTRGAYFFPVEPDCGCTAWREGNLCDFHRSSYDWSAFVAPDREWARQAETPAHMGEFVWTGFDYLGGPGNTKTERSKPKFSDPAAQKRAEEEVKSFGLCQSARHSCPCGLFDLAGFRKDRFYLYQAKWRPELPMAHILPHWNWPERVGEVTPVYVYSSGDEVELFLNGTSLGRKRREGEYARFMWNDVVYRPGTLEAVAYKGGKEWARDTVKTTGPAAKLTVEFEKPETKVGALAFVTVSVRDASGAVVPRAANRVRVTVEGPAEFVASDNGDEADFESFKSPDRRVFNGLLSVVLRTKGPGKVIVSVGSAGLESARVGTVIQ